MNAMPTKRTRMDNRKSDYVNVRVWAKTVALLEELHWSKRESRVQILSYAVKEYHERWMADVKAKEGKK